MVADRPILFRDFGAIWRFRRGRLRAGRDPEQQKLARQFLTHLRLGLETHDPRFVHLGFELLRLVRGSDPVMFHPPAPWEYTEVFFEDLKETLTDFFLSSLILIEYEAPRPYKELERPPLPELYFPPPPKETNDTFYDVRFVDEVGEPINGLEVEYLAGSRVETLTTNLAGVALWEGVMEMYATVSVVDIEELGKILEPRWQTPRSARPLRGMNIHKFVFTGADIRNVSVKPAVPNTIMILPLRGRLFLELYDKQGRVRHAKTAYQIRGPEEFSGTTDEQAQLLHENVVSGDYTVSITVEDRSFEAPAVVLPAGAGAPQIRMLGVVPRSVMASVRGYTFEKNKAFVLPAALGGLREVRELFFTTAPSTVLVVGHADTTGGPMVNQPLSLDRAECALALLKGDVDKWLGMYEAQKPWGPREDGLMIAAMPDYKTRAKGDPPVKWFQRTRGLEDDNVMGPITRRKVVEEYMALVGKGLSSETGFTSETVTHGCGENFPLDETGQEPDEAPADGQEDPLDRRVDFFFCDAEFGIVPLPPGKNSAPGSTEYPEWVRRSLAKHIFTGSGKAHQLVMLEMHDALFRTDSTVLLPEGETPTEDGEGHTSLTTVGLLAAVLRYNGEHPGKKLLVAGHCDTRGDVAYNQPLSEERARVVTALLTGDRESFKALCDKRQDPVDLTQIFDWAARALGFDCQPTRTDATPSETTIRRFQTAYNDHREAIGAGAYPALNVDGDAGPMTWGAICDCYEHALGEELGEDAAGVASLRGKVVWVDPEQPWRGYSEHYPVDEIGRENYRSQENRRVEVLFFDEGEEPDLALEQGHPELSEVYLPGNYEREHLDVDSALPGSTVDLIGVRGTTRFSANSDFPKPSLLRAVRAIQSRMASDPSLQVLLVGHADDVGVDQSELELSLARAEAVEAWLTGDTSSLTSRFATAGTALTWSWREIQWMLEVVRAGSLPCYVDRVDGYPGPNTHRALEYFQVTEGLPVTGLADDATLERLVERYVGLGDSPVSPERVRTVGAGKARRPRSFGKQEQTPVFPDDAPQRLRRVEALLFPNALNPPETALAADATVYERWCRRVVETLDVSEPLPTVIALVDESGRTLNGTSFSVMEPDEAGNLASIGSGTTDEQGVAALVLPEGYFAVTAGDLQGVIDVSYDEFGGERLVVLSQGRV